MPTPEVAQQLVDLGAVTLLVFLVALILVGAFRKWWVPGWMYEKLEKDNQILRDQGDRNSKALEALVADEQREQRHTGRGQ